MKIIGLIIINVLLLVLGQILWKMGIASAGGVSMGNIFRLIFSSYIIAGLGLYVIATVIWFIVLAHADLSYAYPLQSTAYVFGVIAGWLIFKEVIPVTRWAGVLVILVGVALVSYK